MSLCLLSPVSQQTLIVRAYIEPNKSAPQQTPTPQKAPETLTKKQRQHAAKREAEKAAKAAAAQQAPLAVAAEESAAAWVQAP